MIDKTIKLDLACGKDDLRPVMQYIKVTKEVMVATDAHIMAVIPTEVVFDDVEFRNAIPEEGILIHREDWKKLLQYEYGVWKTEGEVIKLISSKKRNLLIEVEKEDEVGKYPNWSAVIPDKEYQTHELNEVGVNFELAINLQKALGLKSCKMKFSENNKPIYITSATGEVNDERHGIVMPVMIK